MIMCREITNFCKIIEDARKCAKTLKKQNYGFIFADKKIRKNFVEANLYRLAKNREVSQNQSTRKLISTKINLLNGANLTSSH